jgi:hypothetical protein
MRVGGRACLERRGHGEVRGSRSRRSGPGRECGSRCVQVALRGSNARTALLHPLVPARHGCRGYQRHCPRPNYFVDTARDTLRLIYLKYFRGNYCSWPQWLPPAALCSGGGYASEVDNANVHEHNCSLGMPDLALSRSAAEFLLVLSRPSLRAAISWPTAGIIDNW